METTQIQKGNNPMATLTEARDKESEINVLSFDGGGSRGVMEVVLLRDVMNFATLLQNSPDKLSFLHDDGQPEQLRKLLDSVENPLHPTKLFKFIVGTSTGSLIAFGLVGGKKTKQERQPLTVDEVIEMYKEHALEIFSKTVKEKNWIPWITNKVAGLALPVPTEPYSQEGLRNLLGQYFGEITLTGFPRPNGCIAGAVARQIFEQEPDKMVIFCSGKDGRYCRVADILQASADAPIYFHTPATISGETFIDGGVGGNCPLQQALPKVTELFGRNARLKLVVSIAPPKEQMKIPESQQWKYWLKWFPNQVSDGSIIYQNCRNAYPEASFERLTPMSKDSRQFRLDEQDVEAMIKCVERESLMQDQSQEENNGDTIQFMNQYFRLIAKTSCKVVLESSLSKSAATLNEIRQILDSVGDIYRQQNNFDDALDCHMGSLKALEALSETNEDDFVVYLNKIGKCCQELGKFDEALFYHTEALNKAHSSSALAACFINVGYCQLRKCDCEEALKSSQRGLELLQQLFEDTSTHRNLAEALDIVGLCQQGLEKFRVALEHHNKALDILNRLFNGAAHSDIADTLNNMGICHQRLGELKEALKRHEDCLKMRYQLNGENKADPDTASSLNNIGTCFVDFGRYSEALQYFEDALKMKKQLFGEDQPHPSIARTLHNIGGCYLADEKFREALENQEKAKKMKEQLYGDIPHPSKAKSLNAIGVCKMFLGVYQAALNYHNNALDMLKELCDADQPNADTADTLNNIGNCQQKLGEYTRALDNHKRALDITQQIYGEDSCHPDIVIALECIGVCLREKGQCAEALNYLNKSQELKQELFGEGSHPSKVKSLNEIGICKRILGMNQEALHYHNSALAMLKEMYGSEPAKIGTYEALNNIGECYQKLGDYAQALLYHRRALAIAQNLYGKGSSHPVTGRTLKSIRLCLRRIGDERSDGLPQPLNEDEVADT